jgi:phosphopantetheinyl transferase
VSAHSASTSKKSGDVDTTALAERFFSLRECAGIEAWPDHLRVPGFFACWTRKEVFLKATGDGLSFPLADFSVTHTPISILNLRTCKGTRQPADTSFWQTSASPTASARRWPSSALIPAWKLCLDLTQLSPASLRQETG